jgi:hypothetical protein
MFAMSIFEIHEQMHFRYRLAKALLNTGELPHNLVVLDMIERSVFIYHRSRESIKWLNFAK